MKNSVATLRLNKVFFHLLFLGTMAAFLVSCQTEEMDDQITESATTAVISGNVDFHAAKKKGAPAPGEDPIAVIAMEEGFDELVAALSYVDAELQTGLVDLFLNGTDQYTVFAPTDEAFMQLYNSLDGVDEITDLPATLVRDVLLYHVVEGRRAANSVVPPKNYRTIETLLEKTFKVDPEGAIMAIGSNSQITAANISASNGIIHVINQVLLPIE